MMIRCPTASTRACLTVSLIAMLTHACGSTDSEDSTLDRAVEAERRFSQTFAMLVEQRCGCLPAIPLDDCRAQAGMLEIVPLTPECKREGLALDPEGSLEALRCELEGLDVLVRCVDEANGECSATFACELQFMEARLADPCPLLPDGVLDRQVRACSDGGL